MYKFSLIKSKAGHFHKGNVPLNYYKDSNSILPQKILPF